MPTNVTAHARAREGYPPPANILRGMDLLPGGSGLLDPVSREVEPEGQARVALVTPEAPFDRPVTCLAAVEARVLWPRPGIEDQAGVTAEQHHHVRRRVRPAAGEGQQSCRDLVVGEVGIVQFLEVERSVCDVRGEPL